MRKIIPILLVIVLLAGCGKVKQSSGSYKSAIIDAPYTATYSLDVNIIGNGAVSIDKYDTVARNVRLNLDNPETINLVAITPDSDSGIKWTFVYWTGDIAGDNTSQTILVDGNKKVIAHFVSEIY